MQKDKVDPLDKIIAEQAAYYRLSVEAFSARMTQAAKD